MTLTAAVIGCGRIGSLYDIGRRGRDPLTHAGAYTAQTGVRLVAGVDPLAERRAAFTRLWGVPAFASVDEMTTSLSPDIWSICTGPEHQPGIAAMAIAHGARALWCEKPVAATLADARVLAANTRAAGIPVAVNMLRRWDAGHQAAAEWIRSEFGDLEHGVVHYTRGLRNYGSHVIDLITWWFDTPDWVMARAGYGAEDSDGSPSVLLGLHRAVVALLPVRRASYDVLEVDLLGSRGRIVVGDLGRSIKIATIVADPDWGEPRVLGHLAERFPRPMRGMMAAAAADLVSAITSGSRPRCSIEDGVEVMRVISAVERSLRERRDVAIAREGG